MGWNEDGLGLWRICPICGKKFLPEVLHVYYDKSDPNQKRVCTYSCMRESERRLEDRRSKDGRRLRSRRQLGDCAELTIAEVFGFGGKRISSIHDEVQRMYAEYDPKYPDTYDYTRALLSLFGCDGGEYIYPVRAGSGEKVLYGREHDIVYLCYAYRLRLRRFGQVRIERFQTELCRRIRYYNEVFEGDYDSVIPVIENKLAQRGISVGGGQA